MALQQGARLGAYEITSLIGAGGMGGVYRARDTRLGRDVAIKVLPSQFALDPERVARFTREAQVLASLNLPNTLRSTGWSRRTRETALPFNVFLGRGQGSGRDADIMPDDKRFVAMVVPSGTSSGAVGIRRFDVIANWFEELKQRAPTN